MSIEVPVIPALEPDGQAELDRIKRAMADAILDPILKSAGQGPPKLTDAIRKSTDAIEDFGAKAAQALDKKTIEQLRDRVNETRGAFEGAAKEALNLAEATRTIDVDALAPEEQKALGDALAAAQRKQQEAFRDRQKAVVDLDRAEKEHARTLHQKLELSEKFFEPARELTRGLTRDVLGLNKAQQEHAQLLLDSVENVATLTQGFGAYGFVIGSVTALINEQAAAMSEWQKGQDALITTANEHIDAMLGQIDTFVETRRIIKDALADFEKPRGLREIRGEIKEVEAALRALDLEVREGSLEDKLEAINKQLRGSVGAAVGAADASKASMQSRKADADRLSDRLRELSAEESKAEKAQDSRYEKEVKRFKDRADADEADLARLKANRAARRKSGEKARDEEIEWTEAVTDAIREERDKQLKLDEKAHDAELAEIDRRWSEEQKILDDMARVHRELIDANFAVSLADHKARLDLLKSRRDAEAELARQTAEDFAAMSDTIAGALSPVSDVFGTVLDQITDNLAEQVGAWQDVGLAIRGSIGESLKAAGKQWFAEGLAYTGKAIVAALFPGGQVSAGTYAAAAAIHFSAAALAGFGGAAISGRAGAARRSREEARGGGAVDGGPRLGGASDSGPTVLPPVVINLNGTFLADGGTSGRMAADLGHRIQGLLDANHRVFRLR